MTDRQKIKNIFENFENPASDFEVKTLVSGHINRTYLILNHGRKFILQKINTKVFKQPEILVQNILNISNHLKSKNYPHQFLKPILFSDGKFIYDSEWRIFEFIENSQSFEKAKSDNQVFEAAKFLSEFYSYLNDLNLAEIGDSIPGFLDFNLRYRQFETAVKNAEQLRIENSKQEIEFIISNQKFLNEWNKISTEIPTRIIHADPKISNFLFDKNSEEKIIALIDWDTFMCGPILYDFGDMARSYTNLKNEDDPSEGEIFSQKNYEALKNGFLFYLKDQLTKTEIENLDTAASTVIYIQAVRFLTDYLNGDIYYHIGFREQNLNRTKNQINLLKGLIKSN
ncbi:MAG: aminoglycoside phosphotransferase family protein [Flavobacteriia bacterium]|nr:aminoglycoside phosphotransferase family protein [Flavobacteriia bacterium]